MNGYICFYNGKRVEIEAETKYEAHAEALKKLKPKRKEAHMVHCHLAEKEGKPVVHTPTM